MDTIRLTNNRPSLLHLPDEVRLHDEKGPSPRPVITPSLSLMPGGNNVPRDVWERAKKNEQVQSWLKAKAPNGRPWIEEGGDTSLPEGVQPPEDLGGHTSAQAAAHVDTTENVDLLTHWQEAEGRPEVRNAIARRIAALTGTPTPAQANARRAPK